MAKTEIWIDKPDIPQVVIEMLLATAEEYGFLLYINGVKLWPKEKTPDDPKDTTTN